MILFVFSISSQSLKDSFLNVVYKHTGYNMMHNSYHSTSHNLYRYNWMK